MKTRLAAMAGLVALLAACRPDCREVSLRVAEWQTDYEDCLDSIDTVVTFTRLDDPLVPYTVGDIRSSVSSLDEQAACTHSVTISNTDTGDCGNIFAIKLYGTSGNRREWLYSDYYVIYPGGVHTFSVSHRNVDHLHGSVPLQIVQRSYTTVAVTEQRMERVERWRKCRVDRLVEKDTTVNDCECDVDALKARSQAVRDLYAKHEKMGLTRQPDPRTRKNDTSQ